MKLFISLTIIFLTLSANAGIPVWTFRPLTATTVSVPSNGSAIVRYKITNQSSRLHTLHMQPIEGITQLTTGLGVCGNPFVLAVKNASCTLSLQINGNQLTKPISNGPVVCEQKKQLECYRPSAKESLHINQAPPITDAIITIMDSPLTLTTNSSPGTLTISNTSFIIAATNITSNFTSTALDGNVIETGNTCTNVPPQNSCTLTYTPGSTVVTQTNFPIQGSNTNVVNAAMQIDSGSTITTINPTSGPTSGGAGVTLIGTGFTGATSVTFDGMNATSINVVNSSTVTAVTPAHVVGAVDVVITTPSGSATLTNGYTYLTTAVGQPGFGGTIACLNGGLNNLIAASADNSMGIHWGGVTPIVTGATSNTNGAANTTTIVNTPGQVTPNAATLCNDYEVDSQGNTPCESGNTCYNDWFLPAGINSTASGQMNCLYDNKSVIGGFTNILYWTSTEFDASNAYVQSFTNGDQLTFVKSSLNHVRCVRSFVP